MSAGLLCGQLATRQLWQGGVMFEDISRHHDEPPGRTESWRSAMRAGMARIEAAQPAEAVAHFERAAQERPGHLVTALSLAASLHCAGMTDRALSAFNAILHQDPHAPAAHHGRGLTLHSLGRRAEALEAFREAVRLAPDFARSWASIADITPDEYERMSAVEATASALERGCEAEGVGAKALQKCIAAFLAARRPQDAIALLETNRARFDDTTYHDQLARAYYRQGQFETAFREKQRALLSLVLTELPAAREPNRFDPVAALGAVGELVVILESRGVTSFLVAGTLLGLHREGRLLGYDRDVDIGVIRGPDIAGIIREHPDLMLAHGARPGDRYFALTYKQVAVDIFVHDVRNDHLVCGVSDTPGDIQWRFSPFALRRVNLAGREWTVPHDANRYLAETYGRGWRTPDKGFASAISSPALSGVNLHARAYYAVTRAKTALLQGDRTKARALLRQSPVALDPLITATFTGGDDMQPR